jgi:putative aldouronate transport system permease protein
MSKLKTSLSVPSRVIIYIILIIAALSCLLPILHIIALSFSSKLATEKGLVSLVPVDFNLYSYQVLFSNDNFIRSIGISILRIGIGVPLSLLLCILAAYPLSISNSKFRMRTFYVWIFAFTMFFSGGLIPSYFLINELGMLDTIWALVLPTGVNVFNILLLVNFFRNLPKPMSESAFVDGANHFQVLARIYLPTSTPVIATITLFSIVTHWNSWFDGIIYMNTPANYPLQSYLQVMVTGLSVLMNTQVTSLFSLDILSKISNRTIISAQICIGIFPIMMVYPFLQRYFVSGITIGSVKE